jgi:lactate dehydrogenase-like 2-hydroxyacid dehydrogenase
MPISYCDLHPVAEASYRFVPDLKTLTEESDFLVVATSGGAATHNLVDRPVLDALGLAGVLMNVTRGSIVDRGRAGRSAGRRIPRGGAGLDVFAHEPEVAKAPWAMDNVVLRPHQATATVETGRAMANLVLANLAAHFAGWEPVRPVV